MSESPELKPFKCPSCGGNRIRHLEEVSQYRNVKGVDENGVVVLDGIPGTYYEDHGENHRFYCMDCDHEWPIGDADLDYK